MKYREIKLECNYDNIDYITFDTNLNGLGVDIFNTEEELEINTGVVLDKRQAKKLLIFLENWINE